MDHDVEVQNRPGFARFRLSWCTGRVEEVVATSIEEAIAICGNGEPLTASIVHQQSEDWINVPVAPLARGSPVDWVCPDGTGLRFQLTMGANGLSLVAHKITAGKRQGE